MYTDREVNGLLADLPGWSWAEDGYLEAALRFRDFAHAMLFVNAVAHLAEIANHHPDITVHGYRNVTLRVMSHDVGGITERDIDLVRAIEDLPGTGDAKA